MDVGLEVQKSLCFDSSVCGEGEYLHVMISAGSTAHCTIKKRYVGVLGKTNKQKKIIK